MNRYKYIALILLFVLFACDKTSTIEPSISDSWPPDLWNEHLPEATEYDIVFKQVLDPTYPEYEYDIVDPDLEYDNYVELKRVRLKIADHMLSLDNAVRYELPARMEATTKTTFDGDFTGIPFKSIVYTSSLKRKYIADKTYSRFDGYTHFQFVFQAFYTWPGNILYALLDIYSPGLDIAPMAMYAFCLDTDHDHSGSGILHQYYYSKDGELYDELQVNIDAENNTIVPVNAYFTKLDSLPGAQWNNYRCDIICNCSIPTGYRCPEGLGVMAWIPGRTISMFVGNGNVFNQTPVEMHGGTWITKENSLYIGFFPISDVYSKIYSIE